MQKIYEKEKKDLEISQIKSPLSTDSSVQSTNAATEKNIPVQKRQTNISIALGFLSLAFIIATVVNDYNDTTSKELKGINQRLKEQTTVTESLQETLKMIGQDLKKKGIDSTKK